jgi:hypothetical protein
VGHGGGTLGNKMMNTFPLFFSKLNRTSGHVNMPGGHALSAHGAGKLIVKTDGQTKTEKDTYAKLCGHQKSKISPDAPDSHKCPRCLEPNETQEHLLQCRHIGAHKKRYNLVHPTMRKICQNKLCPVQEVFTKCIRSWLKSLETSILDVGSVRESQRDLLKKAISDQECIGWHLAMRGYLSKYWGLAVAAN